MKAARAAATTLSEDTLKSTETSIIIDAAPAEVWSHLVDFPSYAAEGWNDYIESIEVELRPGGRVHARTKSPLLSRRELKARILSARFPELSWEAKLPIPGIIYAKHYFRVEELPDGSSRFVQGEMVWGPLTSAFWSLVEKSEPGFVQLNEALKQRVEKAAASPAP